VNDMAEERQVSDVKLDLKMPKKSFELSREELVSVLARILELAHGKLQNKYTRASERLAWSRVIIATSEAVNTILKDSIQEELEERVLKIEEVLERERKNY